MYGVTIVTCILLRMYCKDRYSVHTEYIVRLAKSAPTRPDPERWPRHDPWVVTHVLS